jgi:dolichol-phosphate mannosyltransferase
MSNKPKTLSMVIPVYYNADSLPELGENLARCEKAVVARGIRLEIILVNDGSGDDSLVRLLEFKRKRPETKVINLSRNFGAVAASKAGFQYVTGDGFMILSADLQEPVEQVIFMVDEWLAGEKFVVSARAERGDPLMTKIFAWVYYHLLEVLVVKGYPQGGFDLMLMDSVMLPYMKSSTKSTNPNLYAFWLGFKPRVLYYERRQRKYGRSRWTFGKKLRFLADTLSGFSVTPIRALSGFGAAIALLSFGYGTSTLVAALLENVPVRGFATLAVLISFFSGLILIMLGVLGEYLWRIFDAVNNKPESVVDEAFL